MWSNVYIQDPELDVEAQFSRNVVRRQKRVIANKMRLQCVSGWLWCKSALISLPLSVHDLLHCLSPISFMHAMYVYTELTQSRLNLVSTFALPSILFPCP